MKEGTRRKTEECILTGRSVTVLKKFTVLDDGQEKITGLRCLDYDYLCEPKKCKYVSMYNTNYPFKE